MACGVRGRGGSYAVGDDYPSYRRIESWNKVSEWTCEISCPEILGSTLIRVGTALQEPPGVTSSAGQEGRASPGGQGLHCSQYARPQDGSLNSQS